MFIHEIEAHRQSDVFDRVVSHGFSGGVGPLGYYGLYTIFLGVNEDAFVNELSTLSVRRHGPLAAMSWSPEFLRGWTGFGCPLRIGKDCPVGVVIAREVGLEYVGVSSNDLLEKFPVSDS